MPEKTFSEAEGEPPCSLETKKPKLPQHMASKSPEKAQVSVVMRSGAGEESQPEETHQEEAVDIKEEPVREISVRRGCSMAFGGYIAPTIDLTQDSQLPDRLEDFKRECLTLFGLELKEADVIQWAGKPGKRQFKAWNIRAQDLKIDRVWQEFEKFAE